MPPLSNKVISLMFMIHFLTGCQSFFGGMNEGPAPTNVPDAVPKTEPLSKTGNMPSYLVMGKQYRTLSTAAGYVERGFASWYGPGFHGKNTSSGEPYDMDKMTAASPVLPLPSYARVTNLENGKSIIVRVNDRGPFHKNRVMDLSRAAAAKLGIIGNGTGMVEVRGVVAGEENAPPPAFQPIKGEIYIQVGAYADPNNAQRNRGLVSQKLGQPVRISTGEYNGKAIHRVQVGPYRTVEETDAQAARIQAQGMSTYIIID